MDPNRQAFILKEEIRLLEKQKNELLRDIEHINFSHNEEYKQKQEQIRLLTQERDELDEQVKKRKECLESITEAYIVAKKALDLAKKT